MKVVLRFTKGSELRLEDEKWGYTLKKYPPTKMATLIHVQLGDTLQAGRNLHCKVFYELNDGLLKPIPDTDSSRELKALSEKIAKEI